MTGVFDNTMSGWMSGLMLGWMMFLCPASAKQKDRFLVPAKSRTPAFQTEVKVGEIGTRRGRGRRVTQPDFATPFQLMAGATAETSSGISTSENHSILQLTRPAKEKGEKE